MYNDSMMPPKMRSRRLKLVKGLIDQVPSVRIPELENLVLDLIPAVEEEFTPEELELGRELERHFKEQAVARYTHTGNSVGGMAKKKPAGA